MTLSRSRFARGAVGVVFAVALTGCGESGRPSSPTTVPASSPSSSSAVSPALSPSAAALAAYNGAVADWVHASTTSDNHDPRLADHQSGAALTETQLALASAKMDGFHAEGVPTDSPQVRELTPPAAPTQAFIVDCMDATKWIVRKADGSVADTGPNGRHRIEAVIELKQNAWTVTHMIVRAVGTC